jgi:phospholipid/cholesterol/gamma-HCH transport system substrate-binding protein
VDESRLELKVGVLVAAAVAALVALLYFMGELSTGRGNQLLIDFGHTGNVVRGAPVKLGGIAVGHVESVDLLPSRRESNGKPLPVRMGIKLTPEAFASLRSDAAVTVSTQGPLGEPYLELWPGHEMSAWSAEALRGTDAPRLDLVTNRLAHFLDLAGDMLEKDPNALSQLLTNLSRLSGTADGMMTENRADVRAIAVELASAVRDLRVVAAMAKGQLEPQGKAALLIDDLGATARQARADWPELSRKANATLSGAANVVGPLNEEDGRRLKETLAQAQALSARLDGLAGRADTLFKRLEAGQGTMGALLQDKQAYDDLKTLLADLRKHPWKMLWKE